MRNLQTAFNVFVMVAVLAVGTAAFAAKDRLRTITGEVVKIDATMKTVTVKGTVGKKEKDREVAMKLAPDATVTRHDEKIGLDALKTGDRVVVQFEAAKGTKTARSISLQDKDIKPAELNK